jgi:hypothetical protein
MEKYEAARNWDLLQELQGISILYANYAGKVAGLNTVHQGHLQKYAKPVQLIDRSFIRLREYNGNI